MRILVVVLGILCAGLLALCLILAHELFDDAIRLEYTQKGMHHLRDDRDILRDLGRDLTKGMKRDKIEALVSSKYAQNHIVDTNDPNTVFVDGIGFYFRDDELVDIIFRNESDPSRMPGKPE